MSESVEPGKREEEMSDGYQFVEMSDQEVDDFVQAIRVGCAMTDTYDVAIVQRPIAESLRAARAERDRLRAENEELRLVQELERQDLNHARQSIASLHQWFQAQESDVLVRAWGRDVCNLAAQLLEERTQRAENAEAIAADLLVRIRELKSMARQMRYACGRMLYVEHEVGFTAEQLKRTQECFHDTDDEFVALFGETTAEEMRRFWKEAK